MDDSVPGLELEIRDNSDQAERGLNSLAEALERIKNAVSGGINADGIVNFIKTISTTLSKAIPEENIKRLDRLAESMRALQSVGSVKISVNTGAENLDAMSRATDGIHNMAEQAGQAFVDLNSKLSDTEKSFESLAGSAETSCGTVSGSVEELLSASKIDVMQAKMHDMEEALRQGIASDKWDESKILNTTLAIKRLAESIENLKTSQKTSEIKEMSQSGEDMARTFIAASGNIDELRERLETMRHYLAEGIGSGTFDDKQIAHYTSYIETLEKYLAKIKAPAGDAASGINETSNSASGASVNLAALASNIASVASSFLRLNAKGIGLVLKGVGTLGKGFYAMGSAAVGAVKKTAGLFGELKDKIGLSNTSLGKLASTVKRIAFYRLIRSAIRMVTQGVKEGIDNLYAYSAAMNGSFAKAMDIGASASLKFKNSIAAMLGPTIESIIPLLVQLANLAIAAANAINQFVSVLFGRTTWTHAADVSAKAGKALGGAGKAAKDADDEIKGLLADWDELNIIQQESSKNKGGGGGGGAGGISPGSMFVTENLPQNQWTDLAKQLKDLIESGDWRGAGKLLASKLNEVLDNVDTRAWAKKLNEWFYNGLEAINGFLEEFHFETLGSKIGEFLAEIFGEGNQRTWADVGEMFRRWFMAKVHIIQGIVETEGLFEGVGESLATAVTSLFDFTQSDIDDAAAALGGSINGIATAATKFFDETDFVDIGEKVGYFLSKLFSPNGDGAIDWDGIGEALRKGVESAFEIMAGIFNTPDLGEGIGTSFAKAVNSFFEIDAASIGQTIADGIDQIIDGAKAFITQTKFDEIGAKVYRFLSKAMSFDWEELGETIRTGFFKALEFFENAIFGNGGSYKYDNRKPRFVNNLLQRADEETENESVLSKMAKSIGDLINGVFDLTPEQREKLPQTLSKAVKEAFDAVERFFTNVNWDKIGEDVWYFLSNIDYKGIAESFMKALQAAFEGVGKVADYILLGIYNNLSASFDNAWQGILKRVVVMLTGSDMMGELVSAMFDFGDANSPQFGDVDAFSAYINQGLLQAGSAALGQTKGELDNLYKGADGKYYSWNYYYENIAESADELSMALQTNRITLDQYNTAMERIKGTAKDTKTAVQDTAEAAKDAADGIQEAADATGQMSNGLAEAAETAAEATGEIANVVNEAAEAVGDTGNKWKVGMPVEVTYLSENGEELYTSVIDSAQETAEAIADAANGGVDPITVDMPMDVNPVIDVGLRADVNEALDDALRAAERSDEGLSINAAGYVWDAFAQSLVNNGFSQEQANAMGLKLRGMVASGIDGQNWEDYFHPTLDFAQGILDEYAAGEQVELPVDVVPKVSTDLEQEDYGTTVAWDEFTNAILGKSKDKLQANLEAAYKDLAKDIGEAGSAGEVDWSYLIESLSYTLKQAGFKDEDIKAITDDFKARFQTAMEGEEWDTAVSTALTALSNAIDEHLPDELKAPSIDTFLQVFEELKLESLGCADTVVVAMNRIVAAVRGANKLSMPNLSVSGSPVAMMAEGGVMTTGEMFIAREAGPEMVGRMGSRTAVANNDQIVSGVANGVASANAEQNALLRQQNEYLRQILAKEGTVRVEPSSGWGRFNRQSEEMYSRSVGG